MQYIALAIPQMWKLNTMHNETLHGCTFEYFAHCCKRLCQNIVYKYICYKNIRIYLINQQEHKRDALVKIDLFKKTIK
jgi:hypothetical protein